MGGASCYSNINSNGVSNSNSRVVNTSNININVVSNIISNSGAIYICISLIEYYKFVIDFKIY